jgi:hypothetical protein
MTFDSYHQNLRAAERQAEQQLKRIHAAVQAYQGTGKNAGRPKGKRRKMSAAARKRISEAMKKRWAAKKQELLS